MYPLKGRPGQASPLVSLLLQKLEAIRNQSLDKAPGLDGLGPRFLRLLNQYAPNLICNLFNKLIGMGYFPRTWKIAKVVFFLKKGKSASSAKSYRRVCLLQTISKVQEKNFK